jgi:NMD protein affecting ribosome stability and mRNA decay
MVPQSENRTSYRMDRLIHERVHDPYKTKSKLREPTVCPVCNAVFKEGRWQWADSWPIDAHRQTCQACHRTKDAYPAGMVIVTGSFALIHKAEILNLARHQEAQEKREHPLHRIMQIEEKPNSIIIKTTDIHLPRSIGEALRHAYKGKLELRYTVESHFIEVKWSRD